MMRSKVSADLSAEDQHRLSLGMTPELSDWSDSDIMVEDEQLQGQFKDVEVGVGLKGRSSFRCGYYWTKLVMVILLTSLLCLGISFGVYVYELKTSPGKQ